jgi:hypothetical protein
MAKLRPLQGKYYGTIVELNDGSTIEVWAPDHFAKPFASEREMAAGYDAEEGSHDHVESVRDLAIAQAIVDFCNLKGW